MGDFLWDDDELGWLIVRPVARGVIPRINMQISEIIMEELNFYYRFQFDNDTKLQILRRDRVFE